MNRSEVYDILSEELNTYKVVVNKRPYNKLFIPYCDASVLRVNNSYIQNFNHVYLCNEELVVRDKLAMLQVNIPYRDINELEVFIIEEED